MNVTLLVPTLNEIDGIKTIMPRVKKEWCHQIIIVDGQSTDGTAEYARSHGYHVIVQKKRGLRHAYMEALPYVTGDVIMTFSPSGHSIPELIPACIAKMKDGYDMVIVSRYGHGAHSYADDAITAFGNMLFTSLISLLYKFPYRDAMVMYRAYKKNLITELDLDKDESYCFEEDLFQTTVSWEPLLSIRAAKRRLKIAEIPGDEPAHDRKERKLHALRWGAAHLFEVFREVFVWK